MEAHPIPHDGPLPMSEFDASSLAAQALVGGGLLHWEEHLPVHRPDGYLLTLADIDHVRAVVRRAEFTVKFGELGS